MIIHQNWSPIRLQGISNLRINHEEDAEGGDISCNGGWAGVAGASAGLYVSELGLALG